ncbi:MAG: hypothetical protein ACOZAN_01005 [Patescibacteria group bacterium]
MDEIRLNSKDSESIEGFSQNPENKTIWKKQLLLAIIVSVVCLISVLLLIFISTKIKPTNQPQGMVEPKQEGKIADNDEKITKPFQKLTGMANTNNGKSEEELEKQLLEQMRLEKEQRLAEISKFKSISNEVYNFKYKIPDFQTGEIKMLIFDANKTDGENLEKWWKENIKSEIGGFEVPSDYVVNKKQIHSRGCLGDANPDYSPPPTIEVEIIQEKYNDVSWVSVYQFYDFGKPFIVNYSIQSSGGPCGLHYLSFATISRLH